MHTHHTHRHTQISLLTMEHVSFGRQQEERRASLSLFACADEMAFYMVNGSMHCHQNRAVDASNLGCEQLWALYCHSKRYTYEICHKHKIRKFTLSTGSDCIGKRQQRHAKKERKYDIFIIFIPAVVLM